MFCLCFPKSFPDHQASPTEPSILDSARYPHSLRYNLLCSPVTSRGGGPAFPHHWHRVEQCEVADGQQLPAAPHAARLGGHRGKGHLLQ